MIRSVIRGLACLALCAAGSPAQEAASNEASAAWSARLQPYVIATGMPGHRPDKYLVPEVAQENGEMQKRLALYAEAGAALAEFRKDGPGDRATDELKQAAALVEAALAQFEAACRRQADQDLRDVEAAISQMERFARMQEGKLAAKEPFLFLDREPLARAQSVVESSAGFLGPGDQYVSGLFRRLTGLKKLDAKLRAARIAETKMQPDVYAGGDAQALKKDAEAFVLRAQPGVRILKTSIVTPDWHQESFVEWTDPSPATMRQRITRRLAAQVAGRRHADLRLYSVDVRQDLGAGGWGPVYGQVLFADPILETNIP